MSKWTLDKATGSRLSGPGLGALDGFDIKVWYTPVNILKLLEIGYNQALKDAGVKIIEGFEVTHMTVTPNGLEFGGEIRKKTVAIDPWEDSQGNGSPELRNQRGHD